MENVFTEETCKSCLQEDPQLIPNSVLHLSEYQGEKKSKSSKIFPLHLCPAAPEIYFHHCAQVCLSSHRERSHSRPAVKGSIESSPRPAPCHHVDPTTQHNSETNLTFSPTSRIYPPRKESSCFRQGARQWLSGEQPDHAASRGAATSPAASSHSPLL